MESFTGQIPEKVAVLREYGVSKLEALAIAGSNHLDAIGYLCRRVERDGDPATASERIVEFFDQLKESRMYFNAMRPADRAAAQYAVGVRNDPVAAIEPSLSDVVAGEHSDLAPKSENYDIELDYRLSRLYIARNDMAAGKQIEEEMRLALDRFQRFIPRIRA